jgi:D-alanyl-D-alanine carboxypeptidase/D-alanyl-D-alanine-endopeptidase (penicillin-binding protein 4)
MIPGQPLVLRTVYGFVRRRRRDLALRSWRWWLVWVAAVAVLAMIGAASYAAVQAQPAQPRRPAASAATPASPEHTKPATPMPTAPMPTSAGVTAPLAPALNKPALGSLGVAVADVATGRMLYAENATQLRLPASTAKLATAVGALVALGPADRIPTTTVLEAGTVTLVGGGDPTVSASKLARLARQTAAALRRRARTSVALAYDRSAYAGPATAPGWKPIYVGEGDIAPVRALEVDEGRLRPHGLPRYRHPARAATDAFAADLRADGINVSASLGRRPARSGARRLARVRSPRVDKLVERMLRHSDNTIAEALARQIAVHFGTPPTFAGGAAAVRTVLDRLDVDTSGLRLVDASGLSRRDRASASMLASLLRLATSADHPRLQAVVNGLPVAGRTGTLAGRFGQKPAKAAAGDVRAKTGTLAGVSALAGLTRDHDGRLLAFALLARRPGGADPAESALDDAAAALASCGCR